MATAAPVRDSSREAERQATKSKLARYRAAARQRPAEELGEPEELRKEALLIHEAYSDARARANDTK